jgi:hypothetical protein
MNTQINPESAQPTTVLSFEQSDRNPIVNNWEGNGGQIPNPASSESRVTQTGTSDPNAGVQDYNTGDVEQ